MDSRYTSKELVACITPDCGWKGFVSECQHGYESISEGDEPEMTPCDYCPKCGAIIGREVA